jgi:hypothetical protein
MSSNSSSASVVTKAYGSTISFAPITTTGGTSTIGSYGKIGQSFDLDSPTAETGDIDITNNDSPANTKEFLPGMLDGGSLEFSVKYSGTMHASLMGFAGNGNIYSWKEVFPDGSYVVFPGYIKSATVGGKTEDGALEGKIGIRVTGASTWQGTGGS